MRAIEGRLRRVPAAASPYRRARATWCGRAAPMLLCFVAHLAACGGSEIDLGDSPTIETGTQTFVDTSRPTPLNGSFQGSPERSLETRLWYARSALRGAAACRGSRCALLVLAHGFGGSTARFDAFARSLASAGYIVAAPAFPLTNDRAPGGHATALGDLVRQPGDLSFVIDRLLEESSKADGPLAGRIDASRIGAVGHSLGGATVVALTRLGCCTDSRVDATALVAPAVAVVEPLLHEAPSETGPPTLIVNGSRDPVISPASSQAFFEAIDPPSLFVEVPGAGHSDLIENVGEPAPFIEPTELASVAFFDAILGGDERALDEAVATLRADGVTVLEH